MQRYENGTIRLPHFNAIDCEVSVKAIRLLHDTCRNMQVSYTLDYSESDNRWYVSISSAAEAECYQSQDYSLSTALEVTFDHLEKICKGENPCFSF